MKIQRTEAIFQKILTVLIAVLLGVITFNIYSNKSQEQDNDYSLRALEVENTILSSELKILKVKQDKIYKDFYLEVYPDFKKAE